MKGLEKSALSVSAVASFISELIKNQLGSVLIKGEISNLQLRSHSAYMRFSLKDSSAKIDCFTHQSTNAAKLLPHLQDGDEVIIFAQPSYYIKYGQVSFFTEEMMKLGEGIFQSRLEQLRQKLYAEGLFDQSRKHPLPLYPQHIGVITSADGAALQDILRVAQDRYPIVNISIFPSLVQGVQAPKSLCNALTHALKHDLDAIIIGRGGGSKEDLDAFNDENLVRLIAESSIPIIAAVGHEIDTSLTDYVADLSAPTPTGAAMMLFPDKSELLQEIAQIKNQLYQSWSYLLREETLTIDILKNALHSSYQSYLSTQRQDLALSKLKLQESHPNSVLQKGYAIITSHEIQEGNSISIQTKNKIIHALIQKIDCFED